MTKRLSPREDTIIGMCIHKVFKEHPILIKVWENKVEKYYTRMSDTAMLKALCRDYDSILESRYVCVLPYSVIAHIKLKNVIKLTCK